MDMLVIVDAVGYPAFLAAIVVIVARVGVKG